MDDLISRQDAINAHCELCPDKKVCNCDICPDVELFRLIHAASHWIPVTERLPEDGENVLVTYKTTDKIHPCQYHDDGSRNPWYSYIDQCRAHMNVVLAWMPLPKSYKGEEDE